MLREAIDALEALPRDEPNALFRPLSAPGAPGRELELSGNPGADLERRQRIEEMAAAALRRAIAAGFRDLKAVQDNPCLIGSAIATTSKALMTKLAQVSGIGPSRRGQ